MFHAVFYLLLVTIQLGVPSLGYAEEPYGENESASEDTLSKYWPLTDTQTVVGRLFQCKIPPEKDTFKGKVVEYDVEGQEPNTLPQWLIFDKEKSMLEGVATIEDVGDTQINVKAYDSKGKSASVMFVIYVYELKDRNTDSKRKCRSSEEVLMQAIFINRTLNDIPPAERIKAIHTLSHHMKIPLSSILLLPYSLVVDSSLNYVRTDGKYNDLNAISAVLTWQIGCNEDIWAEQVQVVKMVKKYAKDNTLSSILKLPVIKSQSIANFNPFRSRREVSNGTVGLDDTADDIDDEEADDEDDSDDNIGSSVTPSLQGPLSSISVNTSRFPLGSVEENPTLSSSQNSTNFKSPIASSEFSDDDDETATEQNELEESIFDKQNETFSIAPTPDLDLTPTPFKCTSCDTSEASVSTEKVATSTSSAFPPPRVAKYFGPLTFEAGKLYREQIPEDIFVDENGEPNTRNLTLRLVPESEEDYVWIEFIPKNQTLIILPSSDAISSHNIILEATNSANMSTNITVVIVIQYVPQERNINFEVSLHFLIEEHQRVRPTLLWTILNRISYLYHDRNPSKIMVRHVSTNPFILTWTNNTLPLNFCDNSTIFNLLKVVTSKEGGLEVSNEVHIYIGTVVKVERISWKGKVQCQGVVPPARMIHTGRPNFSPVAAELIDNITARAGELFLYKVSDRAFYDADVEGMRYLRLTFSLLDQNTLPKDNWLQFDDKNLEIYGLPMKNDVGSATYNLVCYDHLETTNENKAARQVIEVKVEPAARTPYNVEFSMTLNSSSISFEEFSVMPMIRRNFVEKLARLFGDKNTKSIVINGFVPKLITVVWYNKTLPVDICPEGEVEVLRKILLTDKKELNENVNEVMGPEYQVLSASVVPIGVCEGGLTHIHSTEVIPANSATHEIHAFISKANFQFYLREYFVEFILPITLLVLMTLLAGIVACILIRKQRRAKWNLNDETERRTYRSRGIPVIFQDELEERLETSNKSPVIMKEEKPPLPPPEYQKNVPMATTALLSDFDEPNYQQEGASYSTRSVERNGNDKSMPTYRKPPPYIPP